jgi:hypothetical protein
VKNFVGVSMKICVFINAEDFDLAQAHQKQLIHSVEPSTLLADAWDGSHPYCDDLRGNFMLQGGVGRDARWLLRDFCA